MDTPPRVGLFLCRCAGALGEEIGLRALGEPGRWPEAALVETHEVLCALEGCAAIADRARALALDRVVVAACSPHEHGATFRGALEDGGLDPYLLEMVNLREQGAWQGGGVVQAARLVRGALARAPHLRALPAAEIDASPDVVVIGGGVAGIEAARRLAAKGRRVFLVEREAALGGQVALLDEVFPSDQCASCFLDPVLGEVLDHPRIEVLLRAEVVAARGVHGRFEIEIATPAWWVDPARCMGLGECSEVCPVSYPDPIAEGTGTRKAIDVPYSGALPHRRSIDPQRCLQGNGCDAPCLRACPTHAIDFARPSQRRTLTCGAVVIATGLALAPVPELPGVISCKALERMMHPHGPTRGAVLLADGSAPASILLATTAETPARDREVAARELGKLARRLRVALPAASVRVGVAASPISREADLVVLWTATVPAPGARALAALLRVDLDAEGFLAETSDPFSPCGTRSAGVYLAGAVTGPRPLAAAIRDGAAAAGRALSAIVPGEKLALDPLAASVDAARCSGCGVCAPACAFGAIRAGERGAHHVDTAFCRGCGACASACPSRAISAPHFETEQLRAQIRGLLSLPRSPERG
jgi:heterodisulfide reductase subunit A